MSGSTCYTQPRATAHQPNERKREREKENMRK